MPEKEAVKVIVRCRPMNEREKRLVCKSCVTVDGDRGQIQVNKVGYITIQIEEYVGSRSVRVGNMGSFLTSL